MKHPPEEKPAVTRRDFLKNGMRGTALVGVGGLIGFLVNHTQADDMVWQIDPYKCVSCGRCATHCVLDISAVKCTHNHAMCGYCELCTGYFDPEPHSLNSGAENQLCPTGAIIRTFVEDPYHEYTIDEALCVGCAKCVKGCNAFGNGSLYLQIHHDQCLNCNECAIARACPSDAFQRVPSAHPYLLKGVE